MGAQSHKVSPTRLITSLLSGEKQEVAIILAYGLGVGLLSLAVPVGVQTLVNNVNFGSFNQPVLFLVLAVFIGLGVAATMRAVQVVMIELLQKRFFSQVALEVAWRIPRLKLESSTSGHLPEFVNRFFDVLTVQKSGAMLLLEGFGLVLQIVLGLILLAFYHWFLLGFAFFIVGCVAVIFFLMGRGAVRTSIEESVQKYRVATLLEDLAARPLMFRSQHARQLALTRADAVVNDYLKARSRHFRILMRQVLGSLALQAIASSALLGIGAFLVVRNQLTLGQLVAAEIVVTTALGSLAKFQKHLEAFYDLVAALDKIDGLLDLPIEKVAGDSLPANSSAAEIEIRDLSFGFEKVEALFTRVSARIQPGSRVALLGSNASGKSTLLDLVYGIKTPSAGTIAIDGCDYRDLSCESLRNHMALIRSIEILPDTIAENVRLGREHLTTEDIRKALLAVGLMDQVTALPDGLQTVLRGDGAPLSVAQGQALMIARAIVGAPRLLLVDEVLDELDEGLRERTVSILLDPKAPWTLVLATHDPELAALCEVIVSMDALNERRAG